MSLKKLLLYFNTVKHLKLRQIAYNGIRRFPVKQRSANVSEFMCRSLKLIDPVKYTDKLDADSLCFLNERMSLTDLVDWHCEGKSKLWKYNLHYFDYLLDEGASEETKDRLIDEWITTGSLLAENAWEPYPLSLRIVNWIKYFIVFKHNNIPERWLHSLFQQASVLFHSIEYHILANHYLKNGKALLYAGAYLESQTAFRWFEKGKKIVLEEVQEQMLADGGHYERSPMYHCIVLEDLLDLVNIVQSNSLNVSAEDYHLLEGKCISALEFMKIIVMPDNAIPLFNDAAFNIAPEPDDLCAYAERLLGADSIPASTEEPFTSLADSGYYLIKDQDHMCVIDCGVVGPEYQPGHTHCDLLSYELCIGPQRLIVDSGVYDYGFTDERAYCRSTRAHNTVGIDGREQSEIWGSFRVARRARVLGAKIQQQDDGGVLFDGSYVPFWGTSGQVVHRRNIHYQSGRWVIHDEVSGQGDHRLNNYIHIHPDVDVEERDGAYVLVKNGVDLARITIAEPSHVALECAWYFPEFGIKKNNRLIKLSDNGALPIHQEYAIEAL